MTVTDGPELNTLRRRSFDIFVREIGLRFVEAYVKRPWARSIDVPVLVGILLLVRHFRPVQSFQLLTLTFDVTSLEVHANKTLAGEALRGGLGGILPANSRERHQVGPVE